MGAKRGSGVHGDGQIPQVIHGMGRKHGEPQDAIAEVPQSNECWSIAKGFIIKRYGMRTPLAIEQLETTVFEAYANIEPRTIAILTKSVEFRIRLCIEHNGHFVGDALGECCRRVRIAIDSANEIQMFPYIQIPREQGGVGLAHEQDQEHDRPFASLPSFRSAQ